MNERLRILVAILAGLLSAAACRAQDPTPDQDARLRHDAIRCLGSLDCNNWPEATNALCASLRSDRYEHIRIEAAVAIGTSCRGNELAVKALEICVTGSDKDGYPAEKSERVRHAAAEALTRCALAPKESERRKNGVINADEKKVDTSEYYARVATMSREEVAASAREVLARFQEANKAAASGNANVAGIAPITPRRDSVSTILSNAVAPTYAKPGQSRYPLVAGLTKALTGRQELGNTVPVKVESKLSMRESLELRAETMAPVRIESK